LKRVPLYVISSLFVIFLTLGVLVRYSVLAGLDLHFSHEVQEKSGRFVDMAMLAFTFLGSPAFICLVAIILALLFVALQRKHDAVYVLLSLISLPLVWGLKEMWMRARPDEKLVHVSGARFGYSFPSGHTLMATAFYGALAVLCWIEVSHIWRGRAGIAILAIMPVMVGVSRIYLGAHWVSDVLGGYAAGLILLFVLTTFYLAARQQPGASPKLPAQKP
jgi:membrane-associated phospholipid phosphatase